MPLEKSYGMTLEDITFDTEYFKHKYSIRTYGNKKYMTVTVSKFCKIRYTFENNKCVAFEVKQKTF